MTDLTQMTGKQRIHYLLNQLKEQNDGERQLVNRMLDVALAPQDDLDATLTLLEQTL